MWMFFATAALAGPPRVASEATPVERLPLDLSPRPIVGGAPADLADFPAVVALYTRNDTFGCTGTLIAPDLVITAGHCGFNMTSVLAATADLSSGGSWHEVAEVFVHPDYASTYDVALYRLSTPVEGVEPAPLLLDCEAQAALLPDADVWLVGFGDIDTWADESTDLLHAALTTIDDPICGDPTRACNESVSPGGELIAGGDGIDTCSGDSGGPLFVDTPSGRFLAGITSRQARPSTVPCGDGGIYARTDAVAAWVEETAALELDWPDCEGFVPVNLPPVASVESAQVVQGGDSVVVPVHVVDDVDQTHTMRLVQPAPYGRVTVSDLDVHILPDARSDEDFVLQLEVTDDGSPPLSTIVELPVEVLGVTVIHPEEPSGGACSSTGLTPWWPRLAHRR